MHRAVLLVSLAWLEQQHVVAWSTIASRPGPWSSTNGRVGLRLSSLQPCAQSKTADAEEERPARSGDKVIISPNLKWVRSTHWLEDADRRLREDVTVVTTFLSHRVKSKVSKFINFNVTGVASSSASASTALPTMMAPEVAPEAPGGFGPPPVLASAQSPPEEVVSAPARSYTLADLALAGREVLSWASWQVRKNVRGDITEEDLIDELRSQANTLPYATIRGQDAPQAEHRSTQSTAAPGDHATTNPSSAATARRAIALGGTADHTAVEAKLGVEEGIEDWADIYFDGEEAEEYQDQDEADDGEVFELVDTAIAGRWRRRRAKDAKDAEAASIYFDTPGD